MGPFSFLMNAAGTSTWLGKLAEGLPGKAMELVKDAAELTVAVEREHAPVGVGGDDGLKGSIKSIPMPETLSAVVMPTVPYAAPVETGSKPHWAPIEPLKAWAALKGLNPYAVRWWIAQRGTKPHPYVGSTYEEMAPQVGETFAAGIAAYLGEQLA